MQLDNIKDAAATPLAEKRREAKTPEKLKQACEDFESIFLSYMLKSMRASFSGINQVGKSSESQLLYEMLDEKMGDEISERGGIGLANMLMEQLQGRK